MYSLPAIKQRRNCYMAELSTWREDYRGDESRRASLMAAFAVVKTPRSVTSGIFALFWIAIQIACLRTSLSRPQVLCQLHVGQR